MKEETIQSKAVHRIRYDEDSAVLEVEFASSLIYRYFDVPRGVYEWLVKADSKGRFINRLVKEQYRYERVDSAESPNGDKDLQQLLQKSIDSPPDSSEADDS